VLFAGSADIGVDCWQCWYQCWLLGTQMGRDFPSPKHPDGLWGPIHPPIQW